MMTCHVDCMFVCNASEMVKKCQLGRYWLLKMKIQRKCQEWLGFEKPYKIPSMFLSFYIVVKPSKSMGT